MSKQNINKIFEEMKDYDYDFLDHLGLSVMSIEDDVKNVDLKVQCLGWNEFVEKKVRLPFFVPLFYKLVMQEKRVITQKEFICGYINCYKDYLKTVLNKKGFYFLKCRLSRTYTSLVRDIHFYHLLKESGQFDKISFNVELDMFDKIDVLVEQNGKRFGIELMTKTKNAMMFYDRKKAKHLNEDEVSYIKLPLNLSKTREIPTKNEVFKLYTEQHIEKVSSFIKKTSRS